MNAVSQLLRVIAILGAAAAGAFYYLSKNQLSDTNAKLTASDTSLKAANSKLADAQKTIEADAKTADDLKKAQDDLAASTKASDDLKKQVSDANDRLKKGAAVLDKANADLTDLRKANAILSNKADQLDRLQATNPNGLAPSSVNPSPVATLPTTTSGNTTAPVAVSEPTHTFSSAPVPTKIVAIDAANGLLVLGVGSNGGLDNNAQLTLQKSGNSVVEVKVTEIHPDFAVATVLSVPADATAKSFSKTLAKELPQGQDIDYIRVK